MGVRSPVVDCGTCLVDDGFCPCVGQVFVVMAATIGIGDDYAKFDPTQPAPTPTGEHQDHPYGPRQSQFQGCLGLLQPALSPLTGGANARSRPAPARVSRSIPRPSYRSGSRRPATGATRSSARNTALPCQGTHRSRTRSRTRPGTRASARGERPSRPGTTGTRPGTTTATTTPTHSSILAYCTQHRTGHDYWIPGSRPTRLNGLAMSRWYRSSLIRRDFEVVGHRMPPRVDTRLRNIRR